MSTGFLDTPTRVAVAGDWHANADYAVDVIDRAARRNTDVLVQLGDFGYRFRDDYLDRLDRALASHGMTLGFVDGNHEDFDYLLGVPIADDGMRHLREHIVHLPRGFRWTWGDTQCVAAGGAVSLDRLLRVEGTSWWPDESLSDADVRALVAGGHADAMFSHDCPAGVTIPGLEHSRRGYPDDAIAPTEEHRATMRRVVDAVRPNRLWHGHFHERFHTVLVGRDYRTVVDGLGRDRQPVDNNMVVMPLDRLGHAAETAGTQSQRTIVH
ncbi:metallophosphoesterase [Rhodococcus sp. HNM0569]|uniref:metallophosphoesterase n=1 Tax=Rhodococcus sp. HNM0569 TaxID=2716340 RepID=UPI00146D55CA|nr:metallophosphoesterase [Rhodococcus sp. HNM0569]NLU84294.1 metallophosphatase [Rhodococcus sp. HNM0569]